MKAAIGGVRVALAAAMLAVCAGVVNAQSTPRIMRKTIVVHAPVSAVWHAWTTEEGARFVSGRSRIELRLGGSYEWFLDGDLAPDGKRGSEGSRVLAFMPEEMLAFEWTFPPDVAALRSADARTQVVVLLEDIGSGNTRVRLNVQGWQDGAEWERGYGYFDRAWQFVLERLKASLEKSS